MPQRQLFFRSFVLTFALLICTTATLHAKTLFVSPLGDDSNAATAEHPLQTISAAAAMAKPGDTVLVQPGVYRERVAPRRSGEPGKPITYRAAPGGRVIVKGSEVWRPNWTRHEEGVYSAKPDDALFDDRSPEYVDNHNPFKVQLASTPWNRNGKPEHLRRKEGDNRIGKCDPRVAYTCGQIFVNGVLYLEAPLQEELKPESWFYDADAEQIFVHFGESDPSDQEVEITTRRRIFAPTERGLGHIVVEGFVFEHCGNQYPTNFWNTDANAQKGAIGTEAGHHWIIRNNLVRYAKTFAIDAGNVDRHSSHRDVRGNIIEKNYIVDNGSAGILSNGSNGLVIRNNVILRNNRLRFLGVKRWEQAGVKCHHFTDGLIERNYIADNYDTCGVWLDNQFMNCRVTRNVIHRNGHAGIFLEMSDYDYDQLLVDNNIIIGNRRNAVYIHDASGATFVHNLLAGTEDTPGYGQAVFIRQTTQRTRSYHHSFFSNLIISNARNIDVNYPAARSGPQRFNHNIYGVDPNERAFTINPKSDSPSPWSQEQFRDLVLTDLRLEPQHLKWDASERDARLTFERWRQFWKKHGVDNDAASVLDDASYAKFDPATQEVVVSVSVQPANVGAAENAQVKAEFFGRNAGADDSVETIPGPFQNLVKGENRMKVWNGLPILAEGRLPSPQWNDNRH